ncbi:MAG TPA: ester cyclase [Gemmatimonadaceae bacterium]|nr:ester cyclase [Gemmatimonadaceae bacterium]
MAGPHNPEANKALIRELFAAWSAHDVPRAAACVADECNGGGRAGFTTEMTAFLAAFPDLNVTVEDILAEGDRVATRVTMRATQQGEISGVAPTGRPVVMKANHIFRCANGLIVQRHGQMDRLEVMMQLGLRIDPQPRPH